MKQSLLILASVLVTLVSYSQNMEKDCQSSKNKSDRSVALSKIQNNK